MAITSKTQLQTDITASTFTAPQKTILGNIVDSYEDIFANLTTVQRDAIATPTNGQIIYNTDNDRYEYWNGVTWFGIGQDLSTPMTVKINLSSADILAMNTTPKVLVAAPGAGYSILPNIMAYRFTYGSVQYTNMVGAAVYFQSKTYSTAIWSGLVTQLEGAASKSGVISFTSDATYNALAENDALLFNTGGTPINGNSTLTIWLTYSLLAW